MFLKYPLLLSVSYTHLDVYKRQIYLLFVMLTLALGVFAQSKGKNAMTLRLVDIKVTDGTLVNIAKEQEAKGNTKPMDMIRIYEGNVRCV